MKIDNQPVPSGREASVNPPPPLMPKPAQSPMMHGGLDQPYISPSLSFEVAPTPKDEFPQPPPVRWETINPPPSNDPNPNH